MLTRVMQLNIKRVYEAPSPDDGFRVLVDRLWPRGLSKEHADVDLWAKDVAPSAELRTAFHHEALPWDAFVSAYRTELSGNPAVNDLHRALEGHEVVTLLYATKDTEHNHAVLLRDALTALNR